MREQASTNNQNPSSLSGLTTCDNCNGVGFSGASDNTVRRCGCLTERIVCYKLGKIPSTFKDIGSRMPKINVKIAEKSGIVTSTTFPDHFDCEKSYFLFGGLSAWKTSIMWLQYLKLTKKHFFDTYADNVIDLVKKYQRQCYDDHEFYDFSKNIFLFIDDIGTLKDTDDRSMQLYDIVNKIYENGSRMTITSNHSLREIEYSEMLGSMTTRITRRIYDVCNVVKILGTNDLISHDNGHRVGMHGNMMPMHTNEKKTSYGHSRQE